MRDFPVLGMIPVARLEGTVVNPDLVTHNKRAVDREDPAGIPTAYLAARKEHLSLTNSLPMEQIAAAGQLYVTHAIFAAR